MLIPGKHAIALTVPEVQPFIPSFDIASLERELHFDCFFEMTNVEQNYYYDIAWFIDEKLILNRTLVHADNITTTRPIRASDWYIKSGNNIGFQVSFRTLRIQKKTRLSLTLFLLYR